MGRKNEEYEVESIIGKRRKKNSGSVEYRVLWKGWGKDQATWEPEENLENVQEMIDEFNRKLEGRGKPQGNSPLQKKPVEETSQNDVRKPLPQKTLRKFNKESDQEVQDPEEEQETKVPVQTNRGKVQKIQEEMPAKIPEKKSLQVQNPPIRNGVKPQIHQTTEVRKPVQKNHIETEDGASDDEDGPQPILEVIGMLVDENGKYVYSVLEKKMNRRVNLKRKEVLKKDPVALVRFYEKYINIL